MADVWSKVYKEANGSGYYYVLRLPTNSLGKRSQTTKRGFATMKDAKAALKRRLKEVDSGQYSPGARVALGEYAEQWLKRTKLSTDLASWTTYSNNLRLYVLPWLGKTKLDTLHELLPEHYAFLVEEGGHGKCRGRCDRATCPNGQPLSHTTVRQVHGAISKVGKAAKREHLISFDPASAVSEYLPSEVAFKSAPWSEKEATAFLLGTENDRLQAAWILGVSHGLRRGEFAGLRWEHIDWEAGLMSICSQRTIIGNAVYERGPKAGSSGVLPVTQDVLRALKAHEVAQKRERLALGPDWTDTGYVFVREDGLPYRPEQFRRIFHKRCEELGIRPIRLHDLRHTSITLAMHNGVPLPVIQAGARHKNLSTTSGYMHPDLAGLREAAATMNRVLSGGRA